MTEVWTVLAICIVVVLSGALPLISKRGNNNTPPPPPKETLHDWRKNEPHE